MRVVLFLLIVVAAAAAFLLTRTGSTAPATVGSPAPQTFSFRDPGTGVQATVSDPKIDETGDAQHVPPAGHEFFVIRATLHNGGKVDQTYFGLDFHAADQDGSTYTRTEQYPTGDGAYIGYGLIHAGQTKSGVLVYVIPRTTTTIALSWDDGKLISPPKALGTFQLK